MRQLLSPWKEKKKQGEKVLSEFSYFFWVSFRSIAGGYSGSSSFGTDRFFFIACVRASHLLGTKNIISKGWRQS
jgi:hypothetical protein